MPIKQFAHGQEFEDERHMVSYKRELFPRLSNELKLLANSVCTAQISFQTCDLQTFTKIISLNHLNYFRAGIGLIEQAHNTESYL